MKGLPLSPFCGFGGWRAWPVPDKDLLVLRGIDIVENMNDILVGLDE